MTALGLATATRARAASLTSLAELAELRQLADAGVEPTRTLRDKLLAEARRAWRWGRPEGRMISSRREGRKRCHPELLPEATETLVEGGADTYAMVLGYHLSGDEELARNAQRHVLDWIGTHGFEAPGSSDYSGRNQCVLELAVSVPAWIEAASLLEGTPGWGAQEKRAFQRWLASEVYPKVAWASRVRRNNWGAAGSLAAMLVADYVDGSVDSLVERAPAPLEPTPREAVAAHREMQLARIRTEWRGDSRCAHAGIQAHGGIPDELRRGSAGCDGTRIRRLDDGSYSYQTMHVQSLVFHAEALRRRGDSSLFDARSPGGAPAILQAILFVIDNPTPGARSWPWRSSARGTLVVAGRYYGDPRLVEEGDRDGTFRGGRLLPYAPLTHGGWPAKRPEGAPGGASQDASRGEPG